MVKAKLSPEQAGPGDELRPAFAVRPLRRDLGFRLLALYLFFVGPVIIASLIFDRWTSLRLEADVKAADLALARAIAHETNTILDNALQAVAQLAEYPAVIMSDSQGMERLFSVTASARPDVNLIYRLDEHGTMAFHYPTGPGSTVGWDFSERDYYKGALKTEHPLLSSGRISPTTGQPVATAVMPLWDEGQFLGLVATNIKLQSLSNTLTSIAAENQRAENQATISASPLDQRRQGFEVMIIDSAGQVIAHPNPAAILTDINTLLPRVSQAVLSGQSGNLVDTNYPLDKVKNPSTEADQAEERLYTYVPIPSAGWGVIVSRPTAIAFATPSAIHRGVLFTMGVFLVVGLFFWLALSREVINPLERLATFSQAVGQNPPISGGSKGVLGGAQIVPGGTQIVPEELRQATSRLSRRPDQIGHLSRSLDRMEKSINARLTELSTLLETSAAVVSSLDTQIVLNRILEQVERLMDIRMCAIVALDEQQQVFRAQASRGLSRRYAEGLVISPTEPQSITLRAIRTGQPVQVSDTEQDASFAASRPRARSEGYRSILAVPLLTQHAPPSALLVYRAEAHVFNEREIGLLSTFANQAAMAIENATLFARSDMRLQEQTRRLEALIQSLQDGLILEDLNGRVLYVNRRMSELTGLSLEEIYTSSLEHVAENLVQRVDDMVAGPPERPADRSAPGVPLRQQVAAALHGNGSRRVEFPLQLSTARQPLYLSMQVFDVTEADGTEHSGSTDHGGTDHRRGNPIARGLLLSDITHDREIDRMKSSLVSTVSHELRTPLAAIKGYASTLLADDVEWDAQAQREFLEIISDETDHLSNLVNDLLDISRIEAGNLPVTRIEFSLEEMVHRAARRAHPSPGERLSVNLPTDLPPMNADPQRIEAVLRNLLENAAKYAGDESPVRVSAGLQSGSIIVRVEDDGPGIPAEDSQRVFKSFYRVENGLAICQGFVRAHGGEIWLEPRSHGTCVAFSLPLDPSPQAERVAATNQNVRMSEQ